MRNTLRAIAAALMCTVLVSGCALTRSGPYDDGPAEDGPLKGITVNVASKNFTEQLILCEITAQRLESQGASVDRTCSMSGSNAVRAALTSGAIDMYWEYTGTGWLALQQITSATDPDELYRQVSALDKTENDIVWSPPAQANNTYAIAATEGTASRLGVRTLSDYAALAATNPQEASFCGASEFFGRDDGWPGLQKAYDFNLANVATLATGPVYNAVSHGDPCNFGEVFATDGRISALNLTLLTDDRKFFLPYNLSLCIRGSVAEAHPELEAVMEPVRELLTTAELQGLNEQVDVIGKDPQEVAAAWLASKDLK